MRQLIRNTPTYKNILAVARSYKQEMAGVLIGYKAKSYLYVFHARIAGSGEPATVASEGRVINTINRVLKKYPELDALSFHTHPPHLGARWQENLSDGDIKNLEHEPDKRTVLASGTGVYEFAITWHGLTRSRVRVQDLPNLEHVNFISELERKVINEINSML